MTISKWLSRNTHSLKGKCIAVSGATGGIGNELCRYLAMLGASLILLDRNQDKSFAFKNKLLKDFPNTEIKNISLNLADFESVKKAAKELENLPPDILIHNAGAYKIPRYICDDTGLDNVFQINFASPYYLTKRLLPTLAKHENSKVIIVSSIAHNYSKIDSNNIDFSNKKSASKVYGNAKRFLMFSMYELFKNEKSVKLSVTHPGITLTNITAHYPKFLFALIKPPMKIIFMKPKNAALSILKGVFDSCGYHEWIGPSLFDIWGYPKKKKLSTCTKNESETIFKIAENVLNNNLS